MVDSFVYMEHPTLEWFREVMKEVGPDHELIPLVALQDHFEKWKDAADDLCAWPVTWDIRALAGWESMAKSANWCNFDFEYAICRCPKSVVTGTTPSTRYVKVKPDSEAEQLRKEMAFFFGCRPTDPATLPPPPAVVVRWPDSDEY